MTIWGHFTFAWDDGTKSASSVSFHFIKNISWPLLSVAPRIFSGSKPRSKPCSFFSSGAFFFAAAAFSAGTGSTTFRFLLFSAWQKRKWDAGWQDNSHWNGRRKKAKAHPKSIQSIHLLLLALFPSFDYPRMPKSSLDNRGSLRVPMCCPRNCNPSILGSIPPEMIIKTNVKPLVGSLSLEKPPSKSKWLLLQTKIR